MKKNTPIGMKERLEAAQSIKELEGLMTEANSYKHASQASERRWLRIHKRKLVELTPAATPKAGKPVEAVSEETTPKKARPNRKARR